MGGKVSSMGRTQDTEKVSYVLYVYNSYSNPISSTVSTKNEGAFKIKGNKIKRVKRVAHPKKKRKVRAMATYVRVGEN